MNEEEVKAVSGAIQAIHQALSQHATVIIEMRDTIIKQEKRIKDLEDSYIDKVLLDPEDTK